MEATFVIIATINVVKNGWKLVKKKKPSNTNLSFGKPLLTKAGTNAVAPGRHSTAIPFSMQARVIKKPGSEMAGVPASEIKAMVSPPCNRLIMFSMVLCSLCM